MPFECINQDLIVLNRINATDSQKEFSNLYFILFKNIRI